mmetsp:Transcript_59839/g.107678  ORF Transcript_59839/g.107678 Transcript_59839/m.107678 type:complete len:213 (-) Transcript_59839:229-867(-)
MRCRDGQVIRVLDLACGKALGGQLGNVRPALMLLEDHRAFLQWPRRAHPKAAQLACRPGFDAECSLDFLEELEEEGVRQSLPVLVLALRIVGGDVLRLAHELAVKLLVDRGNGPAQRARVQFRAVQNVFGLVRAVGAHGEDAQSYSSITEPFADWIYGHSESGVDEGMSQPFALGHAVVAVNGVLVVVQRDVQFGEECTGWRASRGAWQELL